MTFINTMISLENTNAITSCLHNIAFNNTFHHNMLFCETWFYYKIANLDQKTLDFAHSENIEGGVTPDMLVHLHVPHWTPYKRSRVVSVSIIPIIAITFLLALHILYTFQASRSTCLAVLWFQTVMGFFWRVTWFPLASTLCPHAVRLPLVMSCKPTLATAAGTTPSTHFTWTSTRSALSKLN